MTDPASSALAEAITAIERSYEFMLAYAAQGRDFEDPKAGPPIRQWLTTLRDALGNVADLVAAHEGLPAFGAYVDVLRADAKKAKAAVEVPLSLPSIGSQLVDNLNASIHLRALLTDIFLVDEALKSARRLSARKD